MALLACGLARALEEKTRCIERACIHAFTYAHTYTMTSMYYSLKLQFKRRHKSVQFAGISHIGIELDRYTTLHDGLHMVIDACRAEPLKSWLV